MKVSVLVSFEASLLGLQMSALLLWSLHGSFSVHVHTSLVIFLSVLISSLYKESDWIKALS